MATTFPYADDASSEVPVTLAEFQNHVAVSIAAMEQQRVLCEAAQPDHRALAHGRWQLAKIGRRRMKFLIEQVMPLAERHAGTSGGAALLALRDSWPAFGKTISAFLARWPAEAIAANWEGYRREAASFRHEITRRLHQEEKGLRDMLAEIEHRAAAAA